MFDGIIVFLIYMLEFIFVVGMIIVFLILEFELICIFGNNMDCFMFFLIMYFLFINDFIM